MARTFTVLLASPSLLLFLAFALFLTVQPGVVTAQWLEQDAGFSGPNIVVNALDAVDENIAWAVAGTLPITANQEFTRTTDGGSTWIPGIVSGASGFFGVAIMALNASTAWAGFNKTDFTQARIYKTTDGGTTWVHQSTAFPNPGSYVDVVHFFDASNGVAVGDPLGGSFEIYTTSDGGTNWARVPPGNIPPPLFREVGIAPPPSYDASGENIWFGTGTFFAQSVSRVFRSTDRGTTWTTATIGVGPSRFAADVAFSDANNGLATVSDFVTPLVYVTRTTDGGNTWTAMKPPAMPHPTALAWAPGTATYVTTDYGTDPGGPGSAYTADHGDS